MRIWMIRHGKTLFSEQGRYQGRLDPELSEEGRKSLRRADCCPARVYVSPALRARQTAEILFPDAEQIIIGDLAEMDFGAFEGRGWWEMDQDRAYRDWVDGGCTGRCPGGEDRETFSSRVCAAFERILAGEKTRGEEEEIWIVAHGGTQMAVLSKRGVPARDYYQWQTPCGWGWILETTGPREDLCPAGRQSFVRDALP